jgi:hypothetical protein
MPVINTGTESNGISAHGTIVKRNGLAIAELKDITPPPLSRKAIETTTATWPAFGARASCR